MSERGTVRVVNASTAREVVYQSRWLWIDAGQLFSPGCLQIENGRIINVWEGTADGAVNLGDAVVAPGLINAHTHLEFSCLAQPLASGATFPDWIRKVIESRRQPATDSDTAIRCGWEELQCTGTTAVGEIATCESSLRVLAAEGAFGVVFREVLGLQEEAIARGLETAQRYLTIGASASRDASAPGRGGLPTHIGSGTREVLSSRFESSSGRGRTESGPLAPALSPAGTSEAITDAVNGGGGGSVIPSALLRGLSPHAPYSLHPRLFQGLVDLAVTSRALIAMHLAETREELELLRHRSGGLVELLHSLGLWFPESLAEFRRPLDYLHALARCERTLVVHGNYLDHDELDFLSSQPQMSVVYCPRTHAAFRHDPHPWLAMQSRGIRVVLGTDSRASNPDLSLVGELRFLKRQFPCVSDQTLLRMVTADAAEALGLSQVLGTLTPGKLGRFTVISPAKSGPCSSPPSLWE